MGVVTDIMSWLQSQWGFWSTLQTGGWWTVTIFVVLVFGLFYMLLRPEILGIDKTGPTGIAKYAAALLILGVTSIVYAYYQESKYHFKEFVYVPFSEFILGNVSWITFGCTCLIIMIALNLLGALKRVFAAAGLN